MRVESGEFPLPCWCWFYQLLYGALMAGNKAAAAAPGWPLINGDWVPASLFKQSPWMLNFIGNQS
jgi:cytochrome c oxidase assembly protein subunit 15